jgi:hypothetical protein
VRNESKKKRQEREQSRQEGEHIGKSGRMGLMEERETFEWKGRRCGLLNGCGGLEKESKKMEESAEMGDGNKHLHGVGQRSRIALPERNFVAAFQ